MSKLVNKNLTKLVRIDTGYHKQLKILAAMHQRSVKELIEACLADWLPDFEEGKKNVKHK